MDTISRKRLRDLEIAAKKIKYPTLPEKYYGLTTYSDKKANGLTRCVIDFLNLSGWQAERISIMGRPIDNRRIVSNVIHSRQIGSVSYIRSNMTPGTADISATIKGRSVKIEVKIKDKQSEAQKRYQEAIERSGGVYIIARNFDDFLIWYDKFIQL